MEQTKPVAGATIPTATATTKGMGKTIGSSGTSITGGIITSEDYNRRLTGKFAIRQYEIMRRSESSVESALELIKQPLLNVERSIKPPEAEGQEDEMDFRARYLKREFYDRSIDFHQKSEEALTFLDFGYCVMEFTLELTEFEGRTLVGIKDISFRKQISIEKWQTKDGKPGITQQLSSDPGDGDGTTRSIPMQKLIVFTNKKEGDNYEGMSLLRFIFKDFDMKDKIGIVQAVGLEKGAIPSPVVKVPKGADETDKANARESIRQYRANEESFVEIPEGWELDKIDMSGQSLKEILPTMQYHDRQMFVSILAPFFSLGSSDSSGSRSVGETQYKPYVQKLATMDRRFSSPLNAFIKVLSELNWTDNSMGYCKFESARFQDDDVANLASAVKALKDAGFITPGIEDEKHVRKLIHFPDAPDDLEEMYDLKKDQAIELIKNPPVAPDPNNPAPAPSKNPKDDPNLDKPAKTKAAAIEQARVAQRKLIDVLVS